MLQPKNLALEHLCFKPEIDLFATDINTSFGKYAAFRPDPVSMYIDAFRIDWSGLKFYLFSPISVIPRVLSKVKQDSAQGIIVVLFDHRNKQTSITNKLCREKYTNLIQVTTEV